jgi:hypothetical protein
VSGLPIKERHREGVFGTVYRAEREKDQKVLNASITTLITFKGLRHQGSKTVNGHAKARPHVLQVMNWRGMHRFWFSTGELLVHPFPTVLRLTGSGQIIPYSGIPGPDAHPRFGL